MVSGELKYPPPGLGDAALVSHLTLRALTGDTQVRDEWNWITGEIQREEIRKIRRIAKWNDGQVWAERPGLVQWHAASSDEDI